MQQVHSDSLVADIIANVAIGILVLELLTHRQLTGETHRETISALFGALSSLRMTTARVGAVDGIVVL